MRKTLLAAVACGALLVATPASAQSLGFGSSASNGLFGSLFSAPSTSAPSFSFSPSPSNPSAGTNLFFGGNRGGFISTGVKFALNTWSRFTNRFGLRW